jgi:hypothetical protein
MNTDPKQTPTTDLDLLESRLAATLAAALREPTERMPAGVGERLRFAREQALERARASRAQAATPLGGAVAVLGRRGGWWPRVAALLPLAVLTIGVLTLVDASQRDQVQVASEIDAALLADDLPPSAYADPGFVAFLKLQQP